MLPAAYHGTTMAHPPRKIAFVLAATDHGTLIVNRFDYHMVDATTGYGVGYVLLDKSAYEAEEGATVMRLLMLRHQHFGDGVVAVDCGANIGVHTIEWAKGMTSWGFVLAIEAQERIFYALAGNISINNCSMPMPSMPWSAHRMGRCAFRCRTTWRRRASAASSSDRPLAMSSSASPSIIPKAG
jgi:hypothetical protein